MPKKRLTEEGVARLNPPPRGKQADYFDTHQPGLILRVNYGGAKVWRALYYLKRTNKDGKRVSIPTTHKLGRYPTMNVKAARNAAMVFLTDPQKALAETDTGSFAEVAAIFIKRHVEHNKLRSQEGTERLLKKLVYPVWGGRLFHEIRRRDVAELLDNIADAHGARQADMVLAIIRKMMNFHRTRNEDYLSPIVPGMGRYKPKEHQRNRIFDDDEIRTVFKAADKAGAYGAIVKVLLLTGQRREKVATMKWDDLSTDGVWTIATEEREKSNAKTLRLPPMVLDIIAAQPRIAGNPYIFVAGMGNGHAKAFSLYKRQFDKKLPPMEPWVLHDLRRTARSMMSRLVRPDIAERVLGHTIGGVEGTYDRYDYDSEKTDALAKLAAAVDRIVNPPEGDNVVELRPTAGAST
jgi:integrase